MSRHCPCPAYRLAALALATLVAACAQAPTAPVSSLPEKVIRNVPAEGNRADIELPPLPLPPPRLSITTLWFRIRPRGSATRRADESTSPPGGLGTIRVMGLAG